MNKKVFILILMIFCSIFFVDNVKADVLVCKYCNGSSCYYIAQNPEAPRLSSSNKEHEITESDSRQRIFDSHGTERELMWSEGWLEVDEQWTIPYIIDPSKCAPKMYFAKYKQEYGFLVTKTTKTTDVFVESEYNETKDSVYNYIDSLLVFKFGTHDNKFVNFNEFQLVHEQTVKLILKSDKLPNEIRKIVKNTKDKVGETTKQDVGCAIITPVMKEKLNWAFNIIKYGGSALAILLGAIDFFKAVMSDEDSATKKASQRFLKRVIAAVLIFLLPLILQFILNNVEIQGFNADSPTCGVGITE